MHLRLMKSLLLIAVLAIASSVTLPVAAQWKWRDDSGRVQYSDLPPPAHIADTDILRRPSPSARDVKPLPPASAPSSAAPLLHLKASEPELEAKRRKLEEEEAAKKKAEDKRIAAAKADNCSRARRHLRALDDGMRIVRTNEKGEREFLDDKGRAAEAKRARAAITSNCR